MTSELTGVNQCSKFFSCNEVKQFQSNGYVATQVAESKLAKELTGKSINVKLDLPTCKKNQKTIEPFSVDIRLKVNKNQCLKVKKKKEKN